MKSKILLNCAVVLLSAGVMLAQTQVNGDVLGAHDLSPGGASPIHGTTSGACLYCHAPHSGLSGSTPLWNQTLSTATYSMYNSSTYHQNGAANQSSNKQARAKRQYSQKDQTGTVQSTLGTDSMLCLSCHDGTVAPGTTVAYGNIPMSGAMNSSDRLGTSQQGSVNLQGSHPFSLTQKIQDSPDLVASLAASGTTGDTTGAIKLINNNIECTSCHNAHVQSIDTKSPNFLVRDSSGGQMCLACHSTDIRTVGSQTNYLAGWSTSIHSLSTNSITNQAYVGTYGTVGQNACMSCHAPHNAPVQARLIRSQTPPPPTPAEEDSCRNCHSGSNVSPAAPNVFAEFAKTTHPPFPAGANLHDAAEPAVLNQNRHATCSDCHNPHSANQVTKFVDPPPGGGGLRASQAGTVGVSAADGTTVLAPAVNQYESCLRCHGTSTGKTTQTMFGYLPTWTVSAGDPLNLIPQFNQATPGSSHPVMHDRNSPLPQPSLLPYMTDLLGNSTQNGPNPRTTTARILCTDCHNSDDNREFGGTGPNGPHGSVNSHILERKYTFSTVGANGAGGLITNLFPAPDVSVNGPYALCGKCHNLTNLLANASFSEHARHINDGFSCSVCHTAHGMGAISSNISGERYVNFDANVVAQNGATPISYNRSANSCTLTCHGHAHAGSIATAAQAKARAKGK